MENAAQVGSEAAKIGSGDAKIQADNSAFQSVVPTLQNERASLQSDFSSMNSNASQLGETLPEYLSKQSDVDQAISKGQSVIKSATDAMNGYLEKGKQMADSANSLADKAQQHASNY